MKKITHTHIFVFVCNGEYGTDIYILKYSYILHLAQKTLKDTNLMFALLGCYVLQLIGS